MQQDSSKKSEKFYHTLLSYIYINSDICLKNRHHRHCIFITKTLRWIFEWIIKPQPLKKSGYGKKIHRIGWISRPEESLVLLTKMNCFKPLLLLSILTQFVCAEEPKTYFPVSKHGGKATISTFEEEWYSEHLRLMEELSLYSIRGDKSQDVYRFTLLPTWGDPRCAVVTKNEDKVSIRFARLDGDGGYDPGKLIEKTQRELKPEEIKKFLTLFDALDFTKQSTKDPVMGADGSQWILESLIGGEYHIVVRWTAEAYEPKKRGTEDFVKVCNWMLENAPRAKNAEQSAPAKNR